jgi:ribosomal-protein-alanine N-acetyltransferase
MLQFGFQYLGFDEIIASADAPNAASFRVMEKIGMKFMTRENKNGLDAIFYAIARNAFQFDKSIHVIANEVDEQK